jgi:hypothetical protein
MSNNQSEPVQIYFEDSNGIKCTGFFRIEGDIVSVQYRGQTKKTQIGNTHPESLARMMITEMMREE